MQDFSITLTFGEGREFNFRTWKGKERRLLVEASEQDKLTDRMIADILVYGCMETPMYLNQDEVLYTIHKLRRASFNTDINIPFECECGEDYNIAVEDFTEFKPQVLSDMIIDDKKFVMKQPNLPIENMNEIRDKNAVEQVYHEMLVHVDSFVVNETLYDAFTLNELNNFFDNTLSISEFDEALKQFSEMRFKFTPEVHTTCPKCNETTTVLVDYLEEIF